MSFGECIKRRRLELGLTQREVGERLGVTLVAKGEYDPEQFMSGIRNMVTDLIKTYNKVGE